MGMLDKLKMLKVDFLGLATLTTMARACDLIKARHGVEYTLNTSPPTTRRPSNSWAEATPWVSSNWRFRYDQWLVQMKPTGLDNIIAHGGPLPPWSDGIIPDYISRMHDEAEVEYRHPAMEPIFPRYVRYPDLSGTVDARGG